MGAVEVIQWEELGWHFEVAVHGHQAGSLGERMRVVAGSALQLGAEEDVEVLTSYHPVMFVGVVVSVQ
jgi:hypothetical protein